MRAPLSVIIPTLNSASKIGPTLACVFAAVEDGLLAELILADGGSGDGIADLADELGAGFIQTLPGRGTQMAAGAGLATGEWLLFLHSDTVLAEGWPQAARAHMAAGHHAGHFKLRFDAPGLAAKIVAGWANFRSRIFGLPYGDQGLLIPAKLYRDIGGFADIPLMEDVKIARALRGKLRHIPAIATTSAERYLREGWLSRGWRNLGTLALFLAGRAPENLLKRYQNHSPDQ